MTDWHIHTGDCIEVLRAMPAESVHMCVTSPPYFGLRDYGIDGQIGLEQSPAEFVRKMVEVFEEVKRVMRHDATLWMNMGDSYGSGGENRNGKSSATLNNGRADFQCREANHGVKRGQATGLKPKDLMMMPARVALALQEAGWWVRSDIIWCKRAPMPESVTDRPTSAHEHVFLLSKSASYFYDADAVREVAQYGRREWKGDVYATIGINGHKGSSTTGGSGDDPSAGRNMWNYMTHPWTEEDDAWLLSPEPFPEAHFATFPTEIPRRAILAGTSEHGVCGECGAPWKRVVERNGYIRAGHGGANTKVLSRDIPNRELATGGTSAFITNLKQNNYTTGWQPTCRHTSAPVVPATVLDPFSGAGTTVMQALRLGRRGVGIELNPAYVEMSKRRIMADAPLFNTPMEAIA